MKRAMRIKIQFKGGPVTGSKMQWTVDRIGGTYCPIYPNGNHVSFRSNGRLIVVNLAEVLFYEVEGGDE